MMTSMYDLYEDLVMRIHDLEHKFQEADTEIDRLYLQVVELMLERQGVEECK